jgi:hypothetical protein
MDSSAEKSRRADWERAKFELNRSTAANWHLLGLSALPSRPVYKGTVLGLSYTVYVYGPRDTAILTSRTKAFLVWLGSSEKGGPLLFSNGSNATSLILVVSRRMAYQSRSAVKVVCLVYLAILLLRWLKTGSRGRLAKAEVRVLAVT